MTLYNYLKEKNKKLVMLSLFGIHDQKEIPERIVCSYIDSIGKNNKFHKGRIFQGIKNIVDGIPKIGEYVNIEKLLANGRTLYSLLPKDDIVICFDDLERLVENISLNEILGIINDLVENHRFKVLIIANESFIKTKKEDSEQIFKEKVIERTIAFLPDTLHIYEQIIKSYNDKNFTSFMMSSKIHQTIDPNQGLALKSKKYRQSILNLRILKFAIEHFSIVYKACEVQKIDNKELKLQNYWYFILALSIEYKRNTISFEDDRSLSSYIYTDIANFAFDDGEEDEFTFDQDSNDLQSHDELDSKSKKESDMNFSRIFYKEYFVMQDVYPIFHKELYDFITGGKTPNYNVLDENMNAKLKQYIHEENPAHQILNRLLNGIWNFKNDEIIEKLIALNDFVRDGVLEDYMSYLNSYTFLFSYKELIDCSQEEIDNNVKEGIDKFTDKIGSNCIMEESNLDMVYSNLPECTKWVYKYIIDKIKIAKEKQYFHNVDSLEALFTASIEDFVKEFITTSGKTSVYVNTPILGNIKEEVIFDKINTLQPSDVAMMESLIEERYIQGYNHDEMVVKEKNFIHNLNNALSDLNSSDKKLSTILVQRFLLPKIKTLLSKMDANDK